MANIGYKGVKIFKGLKNDEDEKQISYEYFHDLKNYNYLDTGLIGLSKILAPEFVNNIGESNIDGLYEYKYLDNDLNLQTEFIGVCNGNIYKDILTSDYSSLFGEYDTKRLTNGKCSFQFYNNKLFIANGKNYVWVYDGSKQIITQMGAPFARTMENISGNVNGTYAYAITYTTAGGEEVLGSISNTIYSLNKQVYLDLPIGYTGTTSRKIYRASNGDYGNLDLLATISDNTTLAYIDNTAPATISNPIPNINNELPKPYFLQIFNSRLIGCKVDNTPTQAFFTTTNNEVFDSASYVEVSNYGEDNSALEGIGVDFSNIMIGSQKNIYLLSIDPTTSAISVIPTRANVGIKDGYTVKRLPASSNFLGGLMFVSSLNDIRILKGMDALPISNSINNIGTNNWAQNIRGSLDIQLRGANDLYAEFFNYKYHLVINGNKFVFDIRTQGWTYHEIKTENYSSNPYILAVLDNNLYNGQTENGDIEQEYLSIQYKEEDLPAYLETPQINVSDKYSFIQKLIFWLDTNNNSRFKITVIANDNDKDYSLPISEFQIESGAFNQDFFKTDFQIKIPLDYKIYNIYKNCRWLKFKFENNIGNTSFLGWGIYLTSLSN